jgi:hypothetical protein
VLWATVFSSAAFTGSAIYGFRTTGECRRLAAEQTKGIEHAIDPPATGAGR